MTLEEMSMRLASIEDSIKAERDAKRQQEFMDRYGTMFSNNRDIGLAILNQLDRKGVDISAATEAVQSIIQDVLMECAMLMNVFKNAVQQQGELMEKVSDIAQAVDIAMAPTGVDIQSMLAPPEVVPPEGVPPEGMPPEGMPPEGMSPEGAPPGDMPPEGAPPGGTTSDARVKNIIRKNGLVRPRR